MKELSATKHCNASGEAAHLREQAERCRRLSQSVTDPRTVEALNGMASEFEEKARTLNIIN